MAGPRVLLAAALAAASAHVGLGFYLPGVAPREYALDEQVELKVNKLTSTKTHLGYNYYDLAFCRPAGGIANAAENLGEHLTGETIENSPYQLFMKKDETCKVLCDPIKLTKEDTLKFVKMIREEYNVNWIVDNLPAAAVGLTVDGSVLYSRGFPVGEQLVDTKEFFIFNHARITILYHESKDYDGARIVGVEVQPMSIMHDNHPDEGEKPLRDCDPKTGFDPDKAYTRMIITGDRAPRTPHVTFSYDVFWEPSDIEWASRWDIYLSMGGRFSDEIHWFSIVNSLVIVVFLTGMVAMILVRALHRDITRYNRVATDEEKAEDREETGWKLVHGDVFRPPASHPHLFAVVVGVGTQVFTMGASTIVFAAIGFISPANRGSLLTGLLLLFLLSGCAGGYAAARTHKMFDGKAWQRVTLLTALGFPTILFGSLFALNLLVWNEGSVNAIKFTAMLSVLALWALIGVPLVFAGAYYGFKAEKVEFPVRVKAIPRQIPPQPWYLQTPLLVAVGGVLPFGTVFVELFFILTSVWLDMYYYVFGFLLLVFLLMVATCAEIAIVLAYFQLCAEDYRWWWRSMAVPGASGVYLFLYSIFYFYTRLDIDAGTPTVLYFGYMGVVSVVFAMMAGVIGYHATFAFNRKIYSSVKID